MKTEILFFLKVYGNKWLVAIINMFLIWFCFVLNQIVEFRVWITLLSKSGNKWTRGIWKPSALLFAIGDWFLVEAPADVDCAWIRVVNSSWSGC